MTTLWVDADKRLDRTDTDWLYHLPGLQVLDGDAHHLQIIDYMCVHATPFDGTDWVVTLRRQDLNTYHRHLHDPGPPQPNIEIADSAQNRCRLIPGEVLAHVALDSLTEVPRAFSEVDAWQVWAFISSILEWSTARNYPLAPPAIMLPVRLKGVDSRHLAEHLSRPGASLSDNLYNNTSLVRVHTARNRSSPVNVL